LELEFVVFGSEVFVAVAEAVEVVAGVAEISI